MAERDSFLDYLENRGKERDLNVTKVTEWDRFLDYLGNRGKERELNVKRNELNVTCAGILRPRLAELTELRPGVTAGIAARDLV